MPAEAPAAPPPAPATAGGRRGDAPPNNRPVQSGARNAPSNAARPSSFDRNSAARQQMAELGRKMAAGEVTSTSPVEPATPPASQPAPTQGNQPPSPPKPTTGPPTPEQQAAAAEHAKVLATAKRILARDGWHVEDFAKFDEKDIIERAEARKLMHAQTDAIVAEGAKLKRERNADGTFAPKPAETPAEGQQVPPKPEVDPDVEALLSQAETTLGKPATELIGKIANVLAAKAGSRAGTSEMLAREIVLEKGMGLMAKDYPEVAIERFPEVRENFAALLSSGRYQAGQTTKAWTDALFMAFGPPNAVGNAQREALARQSAAVNGHVDPGTLRGNTPAAGEQPSQRDKLRAAAKLFAANAPRSEAELDRMRQSLTA